MTPAPEAPDDRAYDDADDQYLDDALVDAIAIADGADNEVLAHLLRCVLWLHWQLAG